MFKELIARWRAVAQDLYNAGLDEEADAYVSCADQLEETIVVHLNKLVEEVLPTLQGHD